VPRIGKKKTCPLTLTANIVTYFSLQTFHAGVLLILEVKLINVTTKYDIENACMLMKSIYAQEL
jgi:hypothetical protein